MRMATKKKKAKKKVAKKKTGTVRGRGGVALFVKYRERFGLTQEKAAQKLGVTAQTWGVWERGQGEPGDASVVRDIRLALRGG